MNASTIVPVLMAGGSGTRLWPLSRESYPKQFLRLLGDKSLLQDTALRAARIAGATAPLVIGGDTHRFIIGEQMRQVGIEDATVLIEPEGRNTGPAAAVAAHFVAEKHGPDAIVFLMAADQAIADVDAFVAAALAARDAAADGKIVTFGITPTRPETGFGYVKVGKKAGGSRYDVAGFVEKPPLERAEQYLKDGGYYWNGGMFMFRAGVFLAELTALEPDMSHAARRSLEKAKRDIDFVRLDPAEFKGCRSDSIDYAVMEKTKNIALVPLDAGWDDVGSWSFLERQPPSDAHGNRVHGDVLLEDANDNLVHATSRLVTMVGVTNHVVVETSDSVLVTTRDRVQDVKKIVARLKADNRVEVQTRPRVYRPWGWYETIAMGDRFQVKRISVKPNHKLSLQMHHHRAEHWIVVSGTAKVTCGDKEYLLTEDESTYIPLGNRHRLENPGKVPLTLIEVQSGPYLGEDDIVRFDDVYGRTTGS